MSNESESAAIADRIKDYDASEWTVALLVCGSYGSGKAEALSRLASALAPVSGVCGTDPRGNLVVTLDARGHGVNEALNAAVSTFWTAVDGLDDEWSIAAAKLIKDLDLEDAWFRESSPAFLNASEVARCLEVSRQRVAQLRSTADFPKPVTTVGGRPCYSHTDVMEYKLARQKKGEFLPNRNVSRGSKSRARTAPRA